MVDDHVATFERGIKIGRDLGYADALLDVSRAINSEDDAATIIQKILSMTIRLITSSDVFNEN